MRKTQKALSVKRLETEMKEEKQVEFQRWVSVFSSPQTTYDRLTFTQGGEKLQWSAKRLQKKGCDWKRQRPRCVIVVFQVRLKKLIPY